MNLIKKVLVICTGNSCRSQMAEGYLKAFAPKGTIVLSAGVEVHGLNKKAVQIMEDDGIDISSHTSNNIDEYIGVDFDFIITVCDNAKERCPYFVSDAIKFHYSFPDPSKVIGSKNEINESFKSTRDLIKVYCKEFSSAYL